MCNYVFVSSLVFMSLLYFMVEFSNWRDIYLLICWYNAIISHDKSESDIGFPCVSSVAVCRNHIQSTVWNLVIQHLQVHRKDVTNYGNFPPSSPWVSVLVCLFFPPTGVTCPGPGSRVISHDLTPDVSCGLGRKQVFLGHMVLCQWSAFNN